MREYTFQLILIVVVCQTASMIAPTEENKCRYLRIVCALVTLLTILSPVRNIADTAGRTAEAIRNFFTPAETDASDGMSERLEEAAYTIIGYAGERYDIETEGAAVTFFTDEDDTLSEVQIYVSSGERSDCSKLEAELEDELGVPVHIFNKGVSEDG